ncbi:kinase-like protein [Xylona heveae TC161]|uniref:EKC/KEOPS complex subunit BUD32 n=1 Tax=Xylona heveae (strain CBS 132557 / TC161) TaxID=1328760 RepID=A0A165HBU1_XYLHT|nr:kinase-like protein [Xylona heveae TC161]KZF23270.1 kinase-like protein [Xylona heveae TC161]
MEEEGPRVNSYFVSPFPSISILVDSPDGIAGNVVGFGTAVVVGLSADIAFKFSRRIRRGPWGETNFNQAEIERKEDLEELIRRESQNYAVLSAALNMHPNPNILQPCFAVPEGILMPRLKASLQSLQEGPDYIHTTFHQRLLWAKQIANGLAWLEKAGFVHGDLRPANILLDNHGNVVLADFGSSAPYRTAQVTCADLYYPHFNYAGYWSENYAMGWVLYSLFHGSVPDKFNDQIEPLQEAQLPPASHLPLGYIMEKCWRRAYPSVREMEHDVLHEYSLHQEWRYVIRDRVTDWLRVLRIWMFKNSQLRMMQRTYHKLRMENLPYFWQVKRYEDGKAANNAA